MNWLRVNKPQPGCRGAWDSGDALCDTLAFKMTELRGESALNFQGVEVGHIAEPADMLKKSERRGGMQDLIDDRQRFTGCNDQCFFLAKKVVTGW